MHWQCHWICDADQENESYKCLGEDDFCDGIQTCVDGIDENHCHWVSCSAL